MMGFQADCARRLVHTRPGSRIETLERRDLMTGSNMYSFANVAPRTVNPNTANNFVTHPIGLSDAALSGLDNEGRYITGKDRQGDEYTLIVHGPGALIVTDATPNDGSLDDDIDTIQIVGSNPHTTYVTGQVTATARTIVDPDTGVVFFNHLIAEKGVHSIILNGFSLEQTVPPIAGQPNGTGPDVYLPGGVKTLSFHDVINVTDLAGNGAGSDQPTQIVIGDPSTPLVQSPSITIDHIYNTVIDSTASTQDGLGPRTDATVNILVNGNLHALNIGSATAQTITGGFEFNFPRVDVTGRTAVRAIGVDHLKVTGTARNLTASRAGTPFQAQNGQNARRRSASTTRPVPQRVQRAQPPQDGRLPGHSRRRRTRRRQRQRRHREVPPRCRRPDRLAAKRDRIRLQLGRGRLPQPRLDGRVGHGEEDPQRRDRAIAAHPPDAAGPRQRSARPPGPDQVLFPARSGAGQRGDCLGRLDRLGQPGRPVAVQRDRGRLALPIVRGGPGAGPGQGPDRQVPPARRPGRLGRFGLLSAQRRHLRQRQRHGRPGQDHRRNLNGRVYTTGRTTVLSNFGTGIYDKHKVGHLPPPEGPLLHNQQAKKG